MSGDWEVTEFAVQFNCNPGGLDDAFEKKFGISFAAKMMETFNFRITRNADGSLSKLEQDNGCIIHPRDDALILEVAAPFVEDRSYLTFEDAAARRSWDVIKFVFIDGKCHIRYPHIWHVDMEDPDDIQNRLSDLLKTAQNLKIPQENVQRLVDESVVRSVLEE